jgi:hypothetical protein
MKGALILAAILYALLMSCKSKLYNLSDQLQTNFLSHLQKIDSTVVLDSFKVLRIDSIDQRLERTIDDTIYMREFSSVQSQLINAIIEKKEDSIGFYQDEVDYMVRQVDSLNKEISKADTTKKLGIVATCMIKLSRHNGSQRGVSYYFLDKNLKIWNSEMIDSSIANLTKRLN